MKVYHYLDHAATTPVKPEVIEVMQRELAGNFGNPSATHQLGRDARKTVEESRKKMAQWLGVQSSELVFVSNATEANNWILRAAVQHYGIQRIITTRIEHHAVLDVIQDIAKEQYIQIDYLPIAANGSIAISDLEKTLTHSAQKTLVSLMQVNNEVGVVLDTTAVLALCAQHNALFHCDTVQGIGKLDFPVGVDFAVGSAHKFNGPKGVGFAYIKKGLVLPSLLLGGAQEKGWRAGTEATHQIAGMAKALELAYQDREALLHTATELRRYLIEQLQAAIPQIKLYSETTTTLPTILNIGLPWPVAKAGLLVFQLDMLGIGVSRGSACQSGSSKPSHVLLEMVGQEQASYPNLRISTGWGTTQADIDALVSALTRMHQQMG